MHVCSYFPSQKGEKGSGNSGNVDPNITVGLSSIPGFGGASCRGFEGNYSPESWPGISLI